MALNGTEVFILARLIETMAKPVRILSLGYPDLQVSRVFSDRYFPHLGEMPLGRLGPGNGGTERALDARAFFSAVGGGALDVADFLDYGNGEILLDLNQPLPRELAGRYDLVIDPGTLEHCFDVVTAVRNVAALLGPGGWAYHQSCMNFPGHGYFGISPTFYVDFYSANGFDVAEPLCFGSGSLGLRRTDDELCVPWHPIDFATEYSAAPGWLIGVHLAVKRESPPFVLPTQFRYSAAPRPRLLTTLTDLLSPIPDAIGRGMEGNRLR